MFHIKIFLKSLYKGQNHIFLNILGFTIGITLSLLIFLLISYEYNFDNQVNNRKNIFRVVEYELQSGITSASTPLALSNTLKRDFPEIDLCVGYIEHNASVKIDGKPTKVVTLGIAEVDIIRMFDYKLLYGDKPEVLNNPKTAFVTESFAKSQFGNGVTALGKTFSAFDNEFVIKGVIADIPTNSLVRFDVLLSEKTRYLLFENWDIRWWHGGLYTFLTFRGGNSPANFQNRINSIQKKYYPEYLLNRHVFKVVPFKGSHFNTDLLFDLKESVPPRFLIVLSIIAFSVLLIAALNFINISFANALQRSVCIGIKKVNGAKRSSLLTESIIETFALVALCTLFSLFLVNLLLPQFSRLAERSITFEVISINSIALVLLFLSIIVFLVGFVPALYFSGTSPLKVIRGIGRSGSFKTTFNTISVLVQFTIAIVLLVCLSFFYKQVWYMKNHQLGFDKENLLVFAAYEMGKDSQEQNKNAEILKGNLKKFKDAYGISDLSICEFVPGFHYANNFKLYPDGRLYDEGIEMLSSAVDENFLNVFGIKILQGRYFSKEIATDGESVIINETAMKCFGWNSIDSKYIALHEKDYKCKVVGVINDINIKSLQNPIQPMIYRFGMHNNFPGLIALRIAPEHKKDALELIKKELLKVAPNAPFEYRWVSDSYMSAYAREEKLILIISIFSFFTLFLSLLGIYALSRIIAYNRTKEIGIRRANGAKVIDILLLLNWSFVRWVALACIVAFPIAGYIINRWLQQFAYKTSLSWWVFLLAGFSVMLTAIGTVTIQSWRTARRNPVEALRYE